MKFTFLGRDLFAAGMTGLGITGLVFKAYALQWQPVPAFVPQVFVVISALWLIVSGLALLIRPSAFVAGCALTVFLALWVFALQLPVALKTPGSVGGWLPMSEDIALMCGAWTLTVVSAQSQSWREIAFVTDARGLQLARILFGLACLVFGASHFTYGDFTAQMVPEWMPQRLWWAWLTGAGHTAAGLALVSGILPRLASTLEGAMMACFVGLVHIPMVLQPGAGHIAWIMLCVATAMAASALTISGTLSDQSWTAVPPR